jgi:hypothetical protein
MIPYRPAETGDRTDRPGADAAEIEDMVVSMSYGGIHSWCRRTLARGLSLAARAS